MITFPNAKINLGLNIIRKRADGYHEIATLLYPVCLSDILEIVPSENERTTIEITGIPIPGEKENNLCFKAFHLLSSILHLPPVTIHLHKVIPTGSGLGGGSSDGAFTIKMLTDLFHLGMTNEKMIGFARQLGADCAFFIKNKPLFAFDKGDHFEPVDIDLSGFRIEIVTPGIHVNTAEAYALADLQPESGEPKIPVKEIIIRPINEWKNLLVNDFEKAIFLKHPELEKIKQDFYDRGAIYASMSGSGSAVYGIFRSSGD